MDIDKPNEQTAHLDSGVPDWFDPNVIKTNLATSEHITSILNKLWEDSNTAQALSWGVLLLEKAKWELLNSSFDHFFALSPNKTVSLTDLAQTLHILVQEFVNYGLQDEAADMIEMFEKRFPSIDRAIGQTNMFLDLAKRTLEEGRQEKKSQQEKSFDFVVSSGTWVDIEQIKRYIEAANYQEAYKMVEDSEQWTNLKKFYSIMKALKLSRDGLLDDAIEEIWQIKADNSRLYEEVVHECIISWLSEERDFGFFEEALASLWSLQKDFTLQDMVRYFGENNRWEDAQKALSEMSEDNHMLPAATAILAMTQVQHSQDYITWLKTAIEQVSEIQKVDIRLNRYANIAGKILSTVEDQAQ